MADNPLVPPQVNAYPPEPGTGKLWHMWLASNYRKAAQTGESDQSIMRRMQDIIHMPELAEQKIPQDFSGLGPKRYSGMPPQDPLPTGGILARYIRQNIGRR